MKGNKWIKFSLSVEDNLNSDFLKNIALFASIFSNCPLTISVLDWTYRILVKRVMIPPVYLSSQFSFATHSHHTLIVPHSKNSGKRTFCYRASMIFFFFFFWKKKQNKTKQNPTKRCKSMSVCSLKEVLTAILSYILQLYITAYVYCTCYFILMFLFVEFVKGSIVLML